MKLLFDFYLKDSKLVKSKNKVLIMLGCHKIRRTIKFSSCTKNGVFFSAASCKKKHHFGSTYFVSALVFPKKQKFDDTLNSNLAFKLPDA